MQNTKTLFQLWSDFIEEIWIISVKGKLYFILQTYNLHAKIIG